MKLYQNKKWLEHQYIELEKSTIEIGIECNVNSETIRNWLKIFGIPIRTQNESLKTKRSKKRNSESHKGQIPWNKGKTGVYSSETLKLMSKNHKGKKASEKSRNKLSKTMKQKYENGEIEKLIGNKNPNYGKPRSDGTKKKISDANKGQIPWNKGKKGIYSEETLKQIGDAHKGDKNWNWIHNRAERYAPYGENFYDEQLRYEKWDLQNGRDLLTSDKLEWGFDSIFHHINWNKKNDSIDNFCWITRKNHGKVHSKRKRKYYESILKNNLQTLKEGKIPENWTKKNKEMFRQDNLIQLRLTDKIIYI